jgi:hypothetical protein
LELVLLFVDEDELELEQELWMPDVQLLDCVWQRLFA